ncbi:MAG: M36 family metallopeptidase [Lewinellaceae bacterium]|nr:M36 family metallopeptidase [Lewinellaceae bacterium]
MRKNLVLSLGVSVLALFAFHVAFGQTSTSAHDLALRLLQTEPTAFNLLPADVADIHVTDEYVSSNNGVTHIWVQQQYHGIPVFNALAGLHVAPNGKVYHPEHRFVKDLSNRVNTSMPSLNVYQAVGIAMSELGFDGFSVPSVRQKINSTNWIFEGGAISRSPIPVTAVYQPVKDGAVRLCWMMIIEQANTSDVWNLRIDAQTGKIQGKFNQTVYCNLGHPHNASGAAACDAEPQAAPTPAAPVVAGDQYRVFALPIESPIHGNAAVITDPANPTASPFGWHDGNGANGPEYTYTRGNNVWAYDDTSNDNSGSAAESVDGGAGLNFDFPFDGDLEPANNKSAAIVNLFYVNNMMHDITYLYGFDEAAGNFQDNVYGHGGAGGDHVKAEAQDGGGIDNANFSTPSDGGSGRMQMYLWGRRNGDVITVNSPGAIIGAYSATQGEFGANITSTPVTGDAAVVDDGSAEGTKGCGPAVNDLNGKVAIVDRGLCEFGVKALNAQQAGAVGCIICNFEDATIGMAGGSVGGQVIIPTVMMTKSQCDLLKQYAGNGLNISFVLPPSSGPEFVDGDFDNGIIAHEYGHGISNRLTGGPSQAGCLGNAEQMGEGWSDFFSLITTAKAGDTAEKRRGVGTYAFRQTPDGQGIRRYPYSTDLSINPITFSTVAANTEVHALGEIWAQVTWDLYWAMVDKYGFDADITNTNSGNGRAIQLVMDGMKLQPCSPGFLDGRDGIMLADMLNYDGADTCLISEVFARRGMGYFASQGSNENAADGVENFDPIPTCLKELKISKKTTTPTLNPGEVASFVITVTNHKDDAVDGVVVTDPLPAGFTLEGASNGGTLNAGMVTWNLGTMASGQVTELTYSAKTAAAGSVRTYRDEMESDLEWLTFLTEGGEFFYLQDAIKKTGDFAWQANDTGVETDFTLEYDGMIAVSGAKPTLRFWNRYNTEAGADAGFIEVLREGEQQWVRFDKDKGIRNGYPSAVQYGTFAIPYLYGFSGNSNGWVQSYFDMSDYAGENISVRFRFGTDDNTPGESWFVDDVEMLDLLSYNTEACVSSSEGDQACAVSPESGLIMNPGTISGTSEVLNSAWPMSVQPNPATDLLTVSIGAKLEGSTRVSLIGMDGRIAQQRNLNGLQNGQMITLDVQNIPAGVYTVRIDNGAGSSMAKVVIQ